MFHFVEFVYEVKPLERLEVAVCLSIADAMPGSKCPQAAVVILYSIFNLFFAHVSIVLITKINKKSRARKARLSFYKDCLKDGFYSGARLDGLAVLGVGHLDKGLTLAL